MRGDVAEEAQDPRLVAPLLLPVREVDCVLGDRDPIVPAAGQEMRLAEIGQEKRMVDSAVASGTASASSMRVTPSWRRPDSAYAYPRCAAVMSKRNRTSAARHSSMARSSGGIAWGMAPRRRKTKPRLR